MTKKTDHSALLSTEVDPSWSSWVEGTTERINDEEGLNLQDSHRLTIDAVTLGEVFDFITRAMELGGKPEDNIEDGAYLAIELTAL